MKKSHVLFFMLFIGSACFAQPGVLDTDFDADGVRLLDIASASDHTFGLAIQPDGNILAAGPTWDGNVDAMAVYRLLPDGSLDNTFGTNGLVISDANLELKKTNALVLQADGKILIGGASGSPSTAFSVVRLTADGSMDPTFGTNGAVTVEVGGYTDVVNDLIVQPDGKIIAVGTTYGGPLNDEYDIAVVRLNSDGSLDNTFSFDGMLVTDVNGYDWALSVELTSEGKILVGGYTEFTQANTNTLLLQYNADGTSDITFGTNGNGVYNVER